MINLPEKERERKRERERERERESERKRKKEREREREQQIIDKIEIDTYLKSEKSKLSLVVLDKVTEKGDKIASRQW